MDCQEVSERLPWLLNGSLPASQAEDLRAHLARCEGCRLEMEETRRAAAVFDAHLPASAIVDLAWDRAVEGIPSGLARAHVEACSECADELGLARESRRRESEERDRPQRPSVRPGWFVLPATLAAGLVLGFLGGRLQPPSPPATPGPEHVARLEDESRQLRERLAALEHAASALRPRINLPLFEVLPGLVRRGDAEGTTEVAIPAGAAEIALLLSADAPAARSGAPTAWWLGLPAGTW
jgi:hypothetical protein